MVSIGASSVRRFVDDGELAGHRRDQDAEGAGVLDDDGLFVEGIEDVVDEPGGQRVSAGLMSSTSQRHPACDGP